MSAKYKRTLWAALLIAVIVTGALALAGARTRKVMPRVNAQSLSAARGTEKPQPTFATLERSARQTSEQFTAQGDTVSGPESQTSEEQIEVEVITVRPNGFEPREIIRPHGAFMLAISNHSGTAELALRLDRVQGSRIQEARLPKGRVRWTQVLNLPPGDYVLSEQNHPNWICLIKLTPP